MYRRSYLLWPPVIVSGLIVDSDYCRPSMYYYALPPVPSRGPIQSRAQNKPKISPFLRMCIQELLRESQNVVCANFSRWMILNRLCHRSYTRVRHKIQWEASLPPFRACILRGHRIIEQYIVHSTVS